MDARHFTRLIALHILGDPLSVGNLAQYLEIAKEANLGVEITTSGANLSDFDLLLSPPIKQVNFSLDALSTLKNAPFLMRRICDFCAYKVQKGSEIFVNLRVQKRAENIKIIEFLAQNLMQNLPNLAQIPQNLMQNLTPNLTQIPQNLVQNLTQNPQNLVQNLTPNLTQNPQNPPQNPQNPPQNRIKLGNKIIIDFRDVFKWNADSASQNSVQKGTCLAIKTHIGILANGVIVPCCIDASGNLPLGNINKISIDSALKTSRAQKMLQGFRQNRLIERFCQHCDYKNRFI